MTSARAALREAARVLLVGRSAAPNVIESALPDDIAKLHAGAQFIAPGRSTHGPDDERDEARSDSARDANLSINMSPPVAESRSEAELLLMHVLGVNRAWLYAHGDDKIAEASVEKYRALIGRRVAGEPVAYLTGQREFFSLDLRVTSDVLIPRPETELLVELALASIPQSGLWNIADLGTGSGAIALALAHERPQARVLATDASASALAVARANAHRLRIANIEFAQGDWCAPLAGRLFALIVSNPPYIAAADRHLGQGDLRFEPAAALASGRDGLDAIREIVHNSPRHLLAGGRLLLEHGYDQGAAVRALLQDHGFSAIETSRDLEGRDRVSSARYDAS